MKSIHNTCDLFPADADAVEAEDEDTALSRGSEFLHEADKNNELHGECEFLDIEKYEES